MSKLNNKGIGLVEAVLAIAFAIVLVVALLSLTTFNVQNSLNVTERQDATKNSSKLLERLRQIKDENFNNFFIYYNNACTNSACSLDIRSNSPLPCTNPQKGNSCFQISTEPDSSLPVTQINLEIVTYYEQNKTLFSTALETVFTNWRTRQ